MEVIDNFKAKAVGIVPDSFAESGSAFAPVVEGGVEFGLVGLLPKCSKTSISPPTPVLQKEEETGPKAALQRISR
jgi:hypothetical protein